jgi:hypothetical protein
MGLEQQPSLKVAHAGRPTGVSTKSNGHLQSKTPNRRRWCADAEEGCSAFPDSLQIKSYSRVVQNPPEVGEGGEAPALKPASKV